MPELYNLLQQPCLPIQNSNGSVDWMRPAEALADPQARRPAWGRGDFEVATYELLIGLARACFPPDSPEHWREYFDTPPSLETLDEALEIAVPAMNLDGDGPRFCQDFDPLSAQGTTPVRALMLDAPGESTIKKHQDLFMHAPSIKTLGMPAVAMALYALQSFAPSGGAGHRTSMRGGGPMTTLVHPAGLPSLWQIVWANTPEGDPVEEGNEAAVWPWLAPTRTSGKNEITTPEDTHLAQAFFGMPRRIRLDFEEGEGVTCDLTGQPASRYVSGYRTTPRGVNYEAWEHPLSPHYADKKNVRLPLHPKPGRFGYQDWPGVLFENSNKSNRIAAQNVLTVQSTRFRSLKEATVSVHGWAMNNMQALEFVEGVAPLPVFSSAEQAQEMAGATRDMIAAADEARKGVVRAVQSALHEAPRMKSGIPHDAAFRQTLEEQFWLDTEPYFREAFEQMRVIIAGNVEGDASAFDDQNKIKQEWGQTLMKRGLALFDKEANIDALIRMKDPQRVTDARKLLVWLLRGVPTAKGKRKVKQSPLWTALGVQPVETSHHQGANSNAA